MSTTASSTRPRLADLALVTYLAPLVSGRRVAVVGATSGDVARRARLLGAQTVVCFGGTGEDLAVRALTPGSIAAFHGRLDVVIVPDASAVPSLVAVLDEARRALGSEGVVAVGSDPDAGPRPLESSKRGGPDYGALVAMCAERFAEVRVVGRGPFVGYQLATLDEAAEVVTLDTRLVDGDPPRPEGFVAVASDSPVALDPLAVVQVSEGILDALREGAAGEVEAKLKEKEQKLKEVEQASAERWVKLQRLEHGLKEVEEEHRKAREKVVRLSKDLEDERKLRQRIELDQRMVRAAPELPKAPDPELARLREALAAAEKDRDAARAALTAEQGARKGEVESLRAELGEARRMHGAADALSTVARDDSEKLRAALASAEDRVGDLERELDETQQNEAALLAELEELKQRHRHRKPARPELERADDAEQVKALEAQVEAERAQRAELEAEYQRLESELHRVSSALRRAAAEKGAAVEAVRELARSVNRPAPTPAPAPPAVDLAAMNALVTEAGALRGQRDALASRVESLEAQLVRAAGEAQQAKWRADEVEAELSARPAVAAPTRPSAPRVDEREAARLAGALRGMTSRVRELELQVVDLDRALAEERAERDRVRHSATESRNEAARMYALNVSLEARVVHRAMELEGARSGYQRRVVELEQEVERLLRALEVAGKQAAYEAAVTLQSREDELALLRARSQGAAYRLAEAEAALEREPAPSTAVEAERARGEALSAARGRIEALTAELDALRSQVRALAEERDALALQPTQEVSTEGMRIEGVLSDLSVTAERLARTEEELTALRRALDAARGGISAMLADGRGALVAPELMTILRATEVPGSAH
ncbi:MAG: hypothetical protein R3A52_13100 [Polyangiales bacterium]